MAGGRERRVETRYKVSMRAVVSSPDSKEKVPCLIRDASRSGCRVVAAKAHRLPDSVELHFDALDRPIEGTIVWRTARMVGVHFKHALPPDALGEAPEPLDDEDEAPFPTDGGGEMQEIAKRFSATRIKS